MSVYRFPAFKDGERVDIREKFIFKSQVGAPNIPFRYLGALISAKLRNLKLRLIFITGCRLCGFKEEGTNGTISIILLFYVFMRWSAYISIQVKTTFRNINIY